MIKPQKKMSGTELDAVNVAELKMQAVEDVVLKHKKKTLFEYFRSEQMATIMKYLGWFSGS